MDWFNDDFKNYSGKLYSWAIPNLEDTQRILLRSPFSGSINFIESEKLSIIASSPCADLQLHHERGMLHGEQLLNIYIGGICSTERINDRIPDGFVDGVHLTQIFVAFWLLLSVWAFLGGLVYGLWYFRKFRNAEVENLQKQNCVVGETTNPVHLNHIEQQLDLVGDDATQSQVKQLDSPHDLQAAPTSTNTIKKTPVSKSPPQSPVRNTYRSPLTQRRTEFDRSYLRPPIHVLSPSPSDACLATFRLFHNDREGDEVDAEGEASPTEIETDGDLVHRTTSAIDEELIGLHNSRGAAAGNTMNCSLDSGFSHSRSTEAGANDSELHLNSCARHSSSNQKQTSISRSTMRLDRRPKHRQVIREEEEQQDTCLNRELNSTVDSRRAIFDIRHRKEGEFFVSLQSAEDIADDEDFEQGRAALISDFPADDDDPFYYTQSRQHSPRSKRTAKRSTYSQRQHYDSIDEPLEPMDEPLHVQRGNRRRPQYPSIFSAVLLLSALMAIAIGTDVPRIRTRLTVFSNVLERSIERRLRELEVHAQGDPQPIETVSREWRIAPVNFTIFLPVNMVRRIDLLIGTRAVVNITTDFSIVYDASSPVRSMSDTGSSVSVTLNVYEVTAWRLTPNVSATRPLDCESTCEHLCDPITRACVCKSGYRERLGRCIEVDECQLQRVTSEAEYLYARTPSVRLCRPGYECVNSPPGSYQCVCASPTEIELAKASSVYNLPIKPSHYVEQATSLCLACNEQCPTGYYASTLCTNTGWRFQYCSECTRCSPGYYVSQHCTATQDTRCSKCSTCSSVEYELAACSLVQNRVCRPVKQLAGVLRASANVLSENRRAVRENIGERYYSLPTIGRELKLDRGTGFNVRVKLLQVNPVALLRTVDHRDYNDDFYFRGDPAIRDLLCKHPLPESYTLIVDVHPSATGKARFDAAAPHLGYDMIPDEACRSSENQSIGNFPEIRGVACHRMSTRTARIFSGFTLRPLDGINIDVAKSIDKSRICARMKEFCDKCMSQCGMTLAGLKDSDECSITPGDEDNGHSPRLPACYSCCAVENCTSVCNSYYHDSHLCNTERCITSTVLDFRLLPSFHKRGDEFYCHVEPDSVQPVYAFSYRLFYGESPITSNATVRGYWDSFLSDDARTVGRTRQHEFLTVRYVSHLNVVPDVLYGKMTTGTEREIAPAFRVGKWNKRGKPLSTNVFAASSSQNAIQVRPVKPFAVSSSSWRSIGGTSGCERQLSRLLDNFVLSEAPTESVIPLQSDFYSLQGVDFDLSRGDYWQLAISPGQNSTFSIRNVSTEAKPYVGLSIERGESVLVHSFPRTNIARDSLKLMLRLGKSDNELLLNITGSVLVCRGSFIVRVYSISPVGHTESLDSDAQRGSLIYDYEVAVDCPNVFELLFALPILPLPDIFSARTMALTPAELSRFFQVRIEQADGEIQAMVSYAHTKRSISSSTTTRDKSSSDSAKAQFAASQRRADEASWLASYGVRLYNLVMDLPFNLSRLTLLCILCVLMALACLYLLLYFQANHPVRRVKNQQLRLHHVLMFAVYCCAQAAYSVVISFCAFSAMWLVLNSSSVARLSEVPGYMGNLTAEKHLLMELINNRMKAELGRFNNQLESRMNVCDTAVAELYGNLFAEMHDEAMRQEERLNEIRLLMTAARSQAARKLSTFNDELSAFVTGFNRYIVDADAAIVELANSLYNKFSNTGANLPWLAPASVVYRTYMQRRAEALRSGTRVTNGSVKLFDEWLNIATEIRSAGVDLRIDAEIPLIRLDFLDQIFNATQVDMFIRGTSPTNEPPILALPQTLYALVNGTQLESTASNPSDGTFADDRNLNGNTFMVFGANDFFPLFVTVVILCDVLLIASRLQVLKSSMNFLLNGYPMLINVDVDDKQLNSDENDNKKHGQVNGGIHKIPESKPTKPAKKSRKCRMAMSIITTLLERDWLLGIGSLVMVYLLLDLVNVTTDKLANGRVLNSQFGIYSRLLDPVGTHDSLSSNSLNDYKSLVFERYLPVYEASLNNDLRQFEMFVAAWQTAMQTRRNAIRKLVLTLDNSTVLPDDSVRREPFSGLNEFKFNLSQACRFDDFIVNEAAHFNTQLILQSEFDYDIRLAQLVENGESYFSELRLLVRRSTFLVFVYVTTIICYALVSRFCEMISVRFHFFRIRSIYLSSR